MPAIQETRGNEPRRWLGGRWAIRVAGWIVFAVPGAVASAWVLPAGIPR